MIFNSLVSSVPSFRLSLNELLTHPWLRNYPVNEAQAKEEVHNMWINMRMRE